VPVTPVFIAVWADFWPAIIHKLNGEDKNYKFTKSWGGE
jgi:hypothetical protein